jgi:CubicO group peptidase (beta-lactamase class C family)
MSYDLSSQLQPLLDRLVAQGDECGIQVAVYQHGDLRINAVAGLADRSKRTPVTSETLFPVFSVTKGIAATVIHRLAERGLLDYDRPLAHSWPEFAMHGKQDITLRETLFHAAGIPQMPDDVSVEDLSDWDLMCFKIADLEPLWPAGTRIEYHPITYGWLVGEAACRATGKSFGQLLMEEICEPLNLDNLFIGLPPGENKPIAVLEDDPAVFSDPVIPPPGTPEPVPARFGSLSSLMNRRDAQEACVPATNGLFTALAGARHYAALLDHTLLPAHRLELAIEAQKPSRPSGEYPNDRALGYHLGQSPVQSETFGHGGHGGSNAFADPRHGLAIGVNKNRLNRGEGTVEILQEIYRLLGLS